jgi:hypothetical protein
LGFTPSNKWTRASPPSSYQWRERRLRRKVRGVRGLPPGRGGRGAFAPSGWRRLAGCIAQNLAADLFFLPLITNKPGPAPLLSPLPTSLSAGSGEGRARGRGRARRTSTRIECNDRQPAPLLRPTYLPGEARRLREAESVNCRPPLGSRQPQGLPSVANAQASIPLSL